MAVYKQGIDFLPQTSKEEKKEKQKVSKAAVYAAILPLLATIIWLLVLFVNSYYKGNAEKLDATIAEKEEEILGYGDVREDYVTLVAKVESLEEYIAKDFYPQDFFDNITRTLNSTTGAKTQIYSYGRDEDGVFSISGKAVSYLDLAKVMVAFTETTEFLNTEIKSIRYDEEADNVNFEITFEYQEVEEVSEES
jgi:hypothetical protein